MSDIKRLTFQSIPGIPEIQKDDNLASIIFEALTKNELVLADGDVLVLAQKIVSKAEGRLVNLSTVNPSEEAVKVAELVGKRPELVELILRESNEVLRTRPGTIIVEHKSGFVCANAGIDHSNVKGNWGNDDDWVLLLPKDSDASAAKLRNDLEVLSRKHLGVLIIDSHGRAWRNGILGTTIGVSGVPVLVDMRGEEDMYHYKLRVTTIAAADELAAGASLLMGQACEGTPVILVSGFPYELRESSSRELVREKKFDLFR